MAYRITYGRKQRKGGVLPAVLMLIAAGIVLHGIGEGLYDALARFVGGVILGYPGG